MNYNRRNFLKVGGGFAAGMALLPYACTSAAKETDSATFGLQLYSLREDMPKDPKGVLAKVAAYGYKQIESYEGGSGMFWGMSNKAFKAYMDELGMNMVASHCNIDQDFERKAAEAAEIGMKYLICPWRSQENLDGYRKAADDFNAKGEICKRNGIRFAYHNHAYSFTELEGIFPQDIFMENTDPELVDFEMDMYWVVTGGQSPKTWFDKYPGRFKLGHVKDRMANTDEPEATCTLGTGVIDYPSVLTNAQKAGMEYFIVEQERYDGSTPLKSAEDDAAYMKKLKI